jgi:TRAP-type mannitol/chloroaromatic compound transport system permease small subunit
LATGSTGAGCLPWNRLGLEAGAQGGRTMTALLRLSSAIDAVTQKLSVVADWLVLLACLVSAGNASIRYLFSYSSNGWLEIQWYMFGALVLLGASHTLRMNEHVRVDVVYSSVPERAQLWIDALGLVVFFLPVTIFLTFITLPFFVNSFLQQEVSNNAGGLILWPIKAVLPVGFFLLVLQGVSELIKRVAAIMGLLRLDTHYEKPLQ